MLIVLLISMDSKKQKKQPICLNVWYIVLVKIVFVIARGINVGGVWGVVHRPTYVSVGLQMSAVGLKI